MNFSVVFGEAWDGATAASCRGNPVLLAVFGYLMTTPHANMLGAFNLPTEYIAYHLGLPTNEIEEAFAHFENDGFMVRDGHFVFVTRMAEIRLQLVGREEPMAAKDNRLRAAHHIYNAIPSQKIVDAVYERYAEPLRLKPRTVAPPKPLGKDLQKDLVKGQTTASEIRSNQKQADQISGNGHKVAFAPDSWRTTLRVIEKQIERRSFHTWFKDTKQKTVDLSTKTIVVSVPNQHYVDWLTRNYTGLVTKAFATAGLAGAHVAYVPRQIVKD